MLGHSGGCKLEAMARYKSVRIFKSDQLEKLTHVHPITPLVMWTPIVGYCVYRAVTLYDWTAFELAGLALIALLTWTFMEYTLHRFVFHFAPEGKIQERLQFLIHGIHHLDPADPTRLVMPPFPGAVLGGVFFLSFRALMGPAWGEPFFAFFIVGYLAYDYTHYAIHHFTPRTTFGKTVKNHHMQHHFVDHDSRWGVSSPLWDKVFGTMGESRVTNSKSPRARPVTDELVSNPMPVAASVAASAAAMTGVRDSLAVNRHEVRS